MGVLSVLLTQGDLWLHTPPALLVLVNKTCQQGPGQTGRRQAGELLARVQERPSELQKERLADQLPQGLHSQMRHL